MAVKTSLSSTGTLTLSDIGSVYLDGTEDYLSIPTNTAFGYGTGDFTIEFWLYLNSNSIDQSIISNLTSAVSTNPHIWFNNTTDRITYFTANTDRIIGDVLVIGRWYHVAVTKASNSTRLFVNGVQSGTTYSDTNDYGTSAPLGIGTYWASSSPVTTLTLNGYISNLRIVKGTAVYTSNFIPSTVPLTLITNTSLLTCQGPLLRDTSSNNFTITTNGNAAYNDLSPFRPVLKENVIESGSILFDGTNDYLTLLASSKFAVAANQDFTMETWVYLTATRADYSYIIYLYDGSNILQFRIGNAGFGYRVQGTFGGQADAAAVFDNTSYTQNTILNQWTHLALCRSGDSTTFFVNGAIAQTRTGTSSRSIGTPTAGAYISYPDPYGFPGGNISNVRLVVGTALYTSAFTPRPPLDNIPNTQLLLKSTTNSLWLKDDSINDHSITATGAVYSSLSPETAIGNISLRQSGLVARELDEVTPRVSNGFYSAVFDGTGDYLTIPSNYTITGDFTAEAFVYNTGNNDPCILGTLDSANSQLLRIVGNVQIAFFASTITGTITVPKNQWVHLAVSRQGTTVRLFTNGVLSGTPATYGGNVLFRYIGALGVGTDLLTGYISNLRVINGTAIYTSGFSVPTSPLTAVNNTVLLTCQDATSRDNSTNNYTITANGNAAVDNLSPFPFGVAQKQMSDGTLMVAQFSEVG